MAARNYQQNSTSVVKSDDNVSRTPYNDRFIAELVSFDDGSLPLGDLCVSKANLYYSALAILAECDLLSTYTGTKSKTLLNGYNNITCKYTARKVEKTVNVSIKTMAQRVVELYDKYYTSEFLYGTILGNWRWTKQRSEDQKYDPCSFSKGEMLVPLKSASIPLLVKTFRIYLVETVKRLFPRNLDETEWDSGAATYRRGNAVLSSIEFCDFAEVLLDQYWKVILFTPELSEFKSVIHAASEAVKLERQQKQDEYRRKREEEEKTGALEYGAVYIDNVKDSQIRQPIQKSQNTTQHVSLPRGHVKQYTTRQYAKNAWVKSTDPVSTDQSISANSVSSNPPAPIDSVTQPVSDVITTQPVANVITTQPSKRTIKSGGVKPSN